MCFLSRRVFFPATVVTPACSPVRIQGPEPRDEEDLLPVLILLIFPDTAALSCLIVHLLLSCLPCPCHVSVYQLEYSSSSPPPYTDCYNHTHLLYLLPLWRHLTVLFFFLNVSLHPSSFIPPISCSSSSPTVSSVLQYSISLFALPLWPPPSLSALYCPSSIFIFMSSLWFSLCCDCFILFWLLRDVVFKNYVLMLYRRPADGASVVQGQLIFTAHFTQLRLLSLSLT